MLKEINFLGYRLSGEGIRPQPEKTKAIKEAPKPENQQQLKAFLGMINDYSKFLGNLSNTLAPLYRLLQKNVCWHWGKTEDKAFTAAKTALSSDILLTHFSPEKELILTCDASPDGVAAVLSHQDDMGERPIAFASRSLSQAEKNYSQLDREGLSIIFGVKKFHKFLFGWNVTIFTDHKPLLGLFGEHKSIPEHASPRIQRWAITLAAYDYQLKHKPGSENNAEGLSRLPLKTIELNYVPDDVDMLFSVIDATSVDVCDIKRETQKDECLKKVHEYCLNGWPTESVRDLLKPYKNRQLELSLESGCILWGSRVVIPQSLQQRVLNTLHDTHQGASKMKSLARSWFWWPHMDADIMMHDRYIHINSK
ncbi:polyprotein [Elysia marginata]|uniref:Polyprotein n=1 Tax=Elysia marginata TaxID=1093978 RepID=A0AAV4FT93_9GAST|nr:polyprotein [Elysia marginata]